MIDNIALETIFHLKQAIFSSGAKKTQPQCNFAPKIKNFNFFNNEK